MPPKLKSTVELTSEQENQREFTTSLLTSILNNLYKMGEVEELIRSDDWPKILNDPSRQGKVYDLPEAGLQLQRFQNQYRAKLQLQRFQNQYRTKWIDRINDNLRKCAGLHLTAPRIFVPSRDDPDQDRNMDITLVGLAIPDICNFGGIQGRAITAEGKGIDVAISLNNYNHDEMDVVILLDSADRQQLSGNWATDDIY